MQNAEVLCEYIRFMLVCCPKKQIFISLPLWYPHNGIYLFVFASIANCYAVIVATLCLHNSSLEFLYLRSTAEVYTHTHTRFSFIGSLAQGLAVKVS